MEKKTIDSINEKTFDRSTGQFIITGRGNIKYEKKITPKDTCTIGLVENRWQIVRDRSREYPLEKQEIVCD